MNSPLRFHPYLRPMVWGGRRLAEFLSKSLPTPAPHGEAWEISDHGSHHSVIAAGDDAGRTLGELMLRAPEAILGRPAAGPFPWLIKFLDASDWLSVQVHPDEDAAVRLWPAEGGKTEAWFILATQPGSRVYAGLLSGVDERRLRAAQANGTVEECLHEFAPKPGDCLFLPAGTVHAVGGGVVVAEVQQTSDATFRLFDWNRRDSNGQTRKLHVEEALACIDWSSPPVTPVSAYGYPQKSGELGGPAPVLQRLASCRHFELDYVRQTDSFRMGGDRMQALIVLHGRGRLMAPQGPQSLTAGGTLLLPAALYSTRG